MVISNKTMESILGNAELAISNALENEEVKTMLMEYNYDDQRLSEGSALQKNAKELYQAFVREHGQQLEATSQLEKTYEGSNPLYIGHITCSQPSARPRKPADLKALIIFTAPLNNFFSLLLAKGESLGLK